MSARTTSSNNEGARSVLRKPKHLTALFSRTTALQRRQVLRVRAQCGAAITGALAGGLRTIPDSEGFEGERYLGRCTFACSRRHLRACIAELVVFSGVLCYDNSSHPPLERIEGSGAIPAVTGLSADTPWEEIGSAWEETEAWPACGELFSAGPRSHTDTVNLTGTHTSIYEHGAAYD